MVYSISSEGISLQMHWSTGFSITNIPKIPSNISDRDKWKGSLKEMQVR